MALLSKRSLGSQKRLLKRWLHLGRRQSYQLKDIFNADEFGLLYKTLCSGEKHSKVQLTGMAVSNALGEKNVRCLWLENLPVPDASSTFVISFADIDLKRKHRWMGHEVDCKFEMQGRKVVMIVNNCPAYPEVSGLKTINLQFLPPNNTSYTQPMDQGVIRYIHLIIFLFY